MEPAWGQGRGGGLLVGRELAGPEGPHVGKVCFLLLGNSCLGSVFEAELITKSSTKGAESYTSLSI